MQDEVLCIIFLLLDAKTFMITVPQVCKLWRNVCRANLCDVHLDFSCWGETEDNGFNGTMVPFEVLAGWPLQLQTPLMAGAEQPGAAGEEQWASGMCEVFPRTTSVTMGGGQEVEDAHVMALADKCTGLTHANFAGCENLTDAAVLALANKCHGLTHAIFYGCENLTDAALIGLADKCRGLTHANFSYCSNLTNATKTAITEQHPNLIFFQFN